MAEVNNVDDRQIYAFVANIPSFYHSADLRNYFSQFIEQRGFDCFHFRHRPEIVRSHQDNTGSLVCDSNAQRPPSSLSSEDTPSDRTSAVSRRGKRLCCVVRLRQSKFVELVKMYHRKCWLDRRGESIRSLCCISTIKIADGKNTLLYHCCILFKLITYKLLPLTWCTIFHLRFFGKYPAMDVCPLLPECRGSGAMLNYAGDAGDAGGGYTRRRHYVKLAVCL